MKFRPLHDRVVVKRIDAEEKTAGGIIIPDSAKEKPSQGKVIAVGPLAFRNRETAQLWPEGAWCAVGDFIIVPKYQGERTRTKHKRTQTYYSHDGTERTRPVEDDLEVVLFKDLAMLGKIKTPEKAMSFRNFL